MKTKCVISSDENIFKVCIKDISNYFNNVSVEFVASKEQILGVIDLVGIEVFVNKIITNLSTSFKSNYVEYLHATKHFIDDENISAILDKHINMLNNQNFIISEKHIKFIYDELKVFINS
jgi:hypothetical protein